MSDFLDSLVGRSGEVEGSLRPRPVSLFEGINQTAIEPEQETLPEELIDQSPHLSMADWRFDPQQPAAPNHTGAPNPEDSDTGQRMMALLDMIERLSLKRNEPAAMPTQVAPAISPDKPAISPQISRADSEEEPFTVAITSPQIAKPETADQPQVVNIEKTVRPAVEPVRQEVLRRPALSPIESTPPIPERRPKRSAPAQEPGPIRPKIVKSVEDREKRTIPARQRRPLPGIAPVPIAPPQRTQPVKETAARPVINVTIGRIEVKAAKSPAAKTARPASRPLVMSLDDYLKRRNGGNHR